MKEIKEKVRDQSPKIRNPASRLPKELVRSAMLEAKEKSSIMVDKRNGGGIPGRICRKPHPACGTAHRKGKCFGSLSWR